MFRAIPAKGMKLSWMIYILNGPAILSQHSFPRFTVVRAMQALP